MREGWVGLAIVGSVLFGSSVANIAIASVSAISAAIVAATTIARPPGWSRQPACVMLAIRLRGCHHLPDRCPSHWHALIRKVAQTKIYEVSVEFALNRLLAAVHSTRSFAYVAIVLPCLERRLLCDDHPCDIRCPPSGRLQLHTSRLQRRRRGR